MADYSSNRLTLRPDQPELRTKGSVESTASSTASSVSGFEEDEDDKPGSPSKSVFRGVRRGLKKLGSFSRESRKSPAPLQEEAFTARALDFVNFPPHLADQYERSINTLTNSGAILEKPLPQPPRPQLDFPFPIQEDFRSQVADTPKPSYILARALESTAESDQMDSSVPSHVGGMQQGSYMVNGNRSQTSLASSSRDGDAHRNMPTPQSTGGLSAVPSPSQPRSTGVNPVATANPSQHLSGLMCNVHRTTGREPHARVGSTTTILGDKLYVFGGRVLSRSSPILTNDLYELDLIRRHWSKLETTGTPPPPRYFHSVCPLGDTKLVCYGGMSPADTSAGHPNPPQSGPDAQPEVVVMSDVHIYDAPTRTWTHVPTAETPQGRYAHCATILPSSATFSSSNAPLSALHHNPSSSNPNQGSLGVNIDGTGGAEMVIVGGQDSANHYIEQISVFNLRSLRWTSTAQLGKSCGAYRSVVAPVPNHIASQIGRSSQVTPEGHPGVHPENKEAGSSMLIYSNYNFLDVKLELQIRSADGTLSEKPMQGTYTPPGLRFPNGGVIDTNFVVSGTYLTSSKREYALWALDLRTLAWSRIDAGGAVFGQGSWNRGILWNRRNTFVILGNRKRSLVDDYNHRRLNFSNVCMVELEAFGLYDNPRKASPMSEFTSASAPLSSSIPNSVSTKAGHWVAGGRTLSKAAEELGASALSLRELADMEILAVGGERIPVNSRIIARRWGPYFIQLLREGAYTQDGAASPASYNQQPRPYTGHHHANPRNSSITITPSFDLSIGSNFSRQTTLNDESFTASSSLSDISTSNGQAQASTLLSPPTANSLSPSSRPRTLYLPHTYLTLQSLLYYLYTSSLPPQSSSLSTPQILCSLLQLARPYRIDGLAEAVVERLHGVLDSRNAAAVFNAAAMAAGGGRGVTGDQNEPMEGPRNPSTSQGQPGNLRINTAFNNLGTGMRSRSNTATTTSTQTTNENTDNEEEPHSARSAMSSVASSVTGESESETGSAVPSETLLEEGAFRRNKEIWDGDVSCVIGLQKRGLRGLMEGRRMRERGASLGSSAPPGVNPQVAAAGRVGLGIA